MVRATKKSQDPTKKMKPSTSGTESKKSTTHHEPKTRTAGKKDGESSPRRLRTTRSFKVQMIIKLKKTRPQSPKRKASKKTTYSKKTKKANGKSLYGHYHGLMEVMTSPETEPGQSSLDSDTSDQESQ
ncbi:hypothetical protein STEG23_021188 [Scotinomys teguina]